MDFISIFWNRDFLSFNLRPILIMCETQAAWQVCCNGHYDTGHVTLVLVWFMVVLLHMYFPCRCAILDCSEQACEKMPGLDHCRQGAHIMCTCEDPSKKIPDFALKFIRQVLKCNILRFHLHITIQSHCNGLNFSFGNNWKWFLLAHPPLLSSKYAFVIKSF